MSNRSLFRVVLGLLVFGSFASDAMGAPEYACGQFGKPSLKTKKCACTSGWTEHSDASGVSRCVPPPPPVPAKTVAPDSFEALTSLRVDVVKEWGEWPDDPEPPPYMGFVVEAKKRIDADAARLAAFEKRWAAFDATAWRGEAEVRRGLLFGVMRSRLVRSSVSSLEPKVEAQLGAIETKAMATLGTPGATPDAQEKAKELLEKAEAIRAMASSHWAKVRDEQVRACEAAAVRWYLNHLARVDPASLAKSTDAGSRTARGRLAYLAPVLGPDRMQQAIAEVRKAFPGWKPPTTFD
jgi:hypothetical protein